MQRFLFSLLIILISCLVTISQEKKKDYSQLTREEIINLSYDELLAIPLEDLVKLADKLGVSVDDLLNMKITVSSKTALTPRESPGIVSVVTADEIKNSGSRDLIDVLNMVPGFHFGYDIDGVIGIASRGNWGHEGKILILLDGQEMNENFYSTYQFGNRIPMSQIKRIEIIRGPGSAIYGGYAELSVINIITKDASDLKGVNVDYSAGLMQGGVLRNDLDIAAGQKFKDLEYTISGYASEGHRSNKTYENFAGYTYNMAGNAGIIAGQNINSSLKYKALSFRFIYDNYKTQEFDYIGFPFNYFRSYLGEIKYDWKLSDKLTLTPKLNIKEQEPWKMSYSDTIDEYYYHKKNIRTSVNITAQYQPTDKIIGTFGLEVLSDNAKDLLPDSTFYNGKNTISFYNQAAFAQFIFKTKIANIDIGGRVDKHSEFGTNFSPRLGLTKVIDKFHFKILYSKAFRAPAIENININDGIKPEHTTVSEIETGYQFNKSMFLTANVFDISIKDPIIYYLKPNGDDMYSNYNSTGTRGFEVEYRLVKQKYYFTVNYSFYYAVNNKVPVYEVSSDKSYLLGFPKHKVTLNSMFKISNNLNINPSLIYSGTRYAYVLNQNKLPGLNVKSPDLIVNLILNYQNFLIEKLDLSFGIHDIFNTGYEFIEPYYVEGNTYPPLPGYSRELFFRLGYRFDLR